MNIKWIVSLGGVSLLLVASPVFAWPCAHGYVDVGDTVKTVFRKCGQPGFIFGPGGTGKTKSAARADMRWYYDSGPMQLVRVLHFQRGVLAGIDTAGYGPGSPAQACAPADLRTGMSVYALAMRCGKPARKRSKRTPEGYTEIWTYDFGTQYLLQNAVVVEGEVRNVETARRTRRRSGRTH